MYFDDIQQERSRGDVHAGGGGDLDEEIDTVEAEGVIAGCGDEIDGAVDDLDEGVHQRLEGLLERGLRHHVGPQTETVDELPVCHGVNSRNRRE